MNIAKLFLDTVSKRAHQITEFVEQTHESKAHEPWKQLKRIFHSLKSSAMMAGFMDLSQLARLAERASEKHIAQTEFAKLADLLNQGVDDPGVLLFTHPAFQDLKDSITCEMDNTLSHENGSEIQ